MAPPGGGKSVGVAGVVVAVVVIVHPVDDVIEYDDDVGETIGSVEMEVTVGSVEEDVSVIVGSIDVKERVGAALVGSTVKETGGATEGVGWLVDVLRGGDSDIVGSSVPVAERVFDGLGFGFFLQRRLDLLHFFLLYTGSSGAARTRCLWRTE